MKRRLFFPRLLVPLAAAFPLLPLLASAQVGFLTFPIEPGINLIGVTLHDDIVGGGTIEDTTAVTATDPEKDFLSILGPSGTSGVFHLELGDGTGLFRETSTWNMTTLNVIDFGAVATPVDYVLRPQATIASIFGTDNFAGLSEGSGSPSGADRIWIWNGTGWDKYYFDQFSPSSGLRRWVRLGGFEVDPESIGIGYGHAFIIDSFEGNDFLHVGVIKVTPTQLRLQEGINPAGAVSPSLLGATLETAFGTANSAGLAEGAGSAASADQVWIRNGTGWDKYYYDHYGPTTFAPSWVELGGSEVDPATIPLEAGYVIYSTTTKDVTQGVPSLFNESPQKR